MGCAGLPGRRRAHSVCPDVHGPSHPLANRTCRAPSTDRIVLVCFLASQISFDHVTCLSGFPRELPHSLELPIDDPRYPDFPSRSLEHLHTLFSDRFHLLERSCDA